MVNRIDRKTGPRAEDAHPMPNQPSEPNTRKAFVAGATGYTGQAVVAGLRALGVDTIAHVRPDSSRLTHWQQHFTDLGATVSDAAWDVAALTAAFARLAPTEVYCLIGTTSSRAKQDGQARNDAYEAIDYGLTKCLVDALVDAKLAPRFVYLSSMGADASSRMAYLRARGRAEDAVRISGLAHTILRPSFITGSDRDESRPSERFGAAVTNGLLSVAGVLGAKRLRNRYRSVNAETLAHHLITSATSTELNCQTVNLADLAG
ncbi:MAG: hypothetical protein ACI9MR_000512 [Myxococcota bacterium]|jgi:uncharacterized protein YbjT (DUF2867 family)